MELGPRRPTASRRARGARSAAARSAGLDPAGRRGKAGLQGLGEHSAVTIRRILFALMIAGSGLCGCNNPSPDQVALSRAAQGDSRLLVMAYGDGHGGALWVAPGVRCFDPGYASFEPVLINSNRCGAIRDFRRIAAFNDQMVTVSPRSHHRCWPWPSGPGAAIERAEPHSVAPKTVSSTFAEKPLPEAPLSTPRGVTTL